MTDNPSTVAGRKAVCRQLAEVADRAGASVRIVEHWPSPPSRTAMVRIAYGPVEVAIAVGPEEAKHGYVLPWHMNTNQPAARLTGAFAAAAGGSVNPYHRRKCTVGYSTLEQTLARLERTLACLADNTGLDWEN